MAAGALALTITVAGGPATAHHVGTYAARDNEVTQNFKQLKSALEARKREVALRLFEEGAVRRTMTAQAPRLPAGLEAQTRSALGVGDAARAETLLATLIAALARDIAVEARRVVTDAAVPVDARRAAATRFLEAIWRYWNLVDFTVSRRLPKAAVAIRLAFDEAEGLAKTGAAPVAANPCAGPRPAAPRATVDPTLLAAPLARISETLAGVVETLADPTRRDS